MTYDRTMTTPNPYAPPKEEGYVAAAPRTEGIVTCTFMQNEEGQKHSAMWLRGASLPAGRYVVEATQGSNKSTVAWEVFSTPARRAKNVLLFVGVEPVAPIEGLEPHRPVGRVYRRGQLPVVVPEAFNHWPGPAAAPIR